MNETPYEEVPLRLNHLVRQSHRWLSLAFTVAVVANLVAMAVGSSAQWIGFLALLPLLPLLVTGLYLFVLPYRSKARGGGMDAGNVPGAAE